MFLILLCRKMSTIAETERFITLRKEEEALWNVMAEKYKIRYLLTLSLIFLKSCLLSFEDSF